MRINLVTLGNKLDPSRYKKLITKPMAIMVGVFELTDHNASPSDT